MDWAGWLVFGFVATLVLTATIVGAQLAGLSRMDLPTMLGTMFATGIDRARAIGFLMHLVAGQLFALGYAASFALLGRATWWLGAAFGSIHGLLALTLVMPLLPGVHPRMASEREGPELKRALEPPGMLGLNYGSRTPLVALLAHVVYGTILGAFLQPS